MKKLSFVLWAALAAALLWGCTPAPAPPAPSPSPTAPPFVFTRENLPRLDGSTATIPLGQAICSVLLGENREEVADLVHFSRTTASYRALMGGQADLLLAAEPEEQIRRELEREDKWLLTPFAIDALVFIVSKDNPVDSITAGQARDIYAGRITNWRELGGGDAPIMPFQRNADAGSQILLEKLVMGGEAPMTPPADYIPSMGGMMEAVRSFDGGPNAIGFTVYYYANDMKMAEGLKILQIDGQTPDAASIRGGSYPFLNPYYVAIARDAAGDSPTRILYNWILGPEGQALAEHEGYVPAGETPAPLPTPFVFTRENLPRLDGSTSTAPLAEAVCSVLLGERREDVTDLVRFSKTTSAYYSLIWGEADLLIVGEPNGSVLEEKARAGFEWEMSPFATDAFVFVVNESNPVDSITLDQARRIYTGEIKNWSELGGEDREIVPFQRNADAGSQTLMEKLVMDGQPMMEAPTDYIVGTMGQLMEAVKSYDGSPGAIGYSVYYYAEEMKMAQGLKMLALEGVEPTPETIRSGAYPVVNPKYVVIPADAAEGAPNRILYRWLLSPEGQKLVAHEGYVSILEAAP